MPRHHRYFLSILFLGGWLAVSAGIAAAEENITSSFTSDDQTSTPLAAAVPFPPSSLNAILSGGGRDVKLTWTTIGGGTAEFKIFRRAMGETWEYRHSAGERDMSWTDSSLKPGTYEYHVNACSSSGCSPDSPAATITVPSTTSGSTSPPPAPSPSPTPTPTPTPPPPADTTPPTIADVRADAPTASSAEIRWSTDDLSDSRVIYGTGTASYPLGSENRCDAGGRVRSHCVKVTGLTSDTTYHFRVRSVNAVGQEASGGGSLTTASISSSENVPPTIPTTTPSFVPPPPAPTPTPSPEPPEPVPTPPPTPPPALRQKAEISGEITDPAGAPVAKAPVYVRTSDYSFRRGAESDERGAFRLTVPEDEYVVEIFPPAGQPNLLKPAPLAVRARAEEPAVLRVQFFSPTKTIAIIVAFSDGEPVIDAEASAYSGETGGWASASGDASGRVSLRVGGGDWKVAIRPEDPSRASWTAPIEPQEVEFARDGIAETKTLRFVVPVADAALAIRTLDAFGEVVAGVAVEVDTVSAGGAREPREAPPQIRKSDRAGEIRLTLRAGTYHLRAALPPGRGYVNPEEVVVHLTPGIAAEVRLVFRRVEPANVTRVSGTTRLEDGEAVRALVWAWSEKGRSVETRSEATGNFGLELATGDRWHIGAGKDVDDIPYKSSEIIVGTTGEAIGIELVLIPQARKPLPKAVKTREAANKQIVSQASDGASFSLPPSAAATSGTVEIGMTPTVEAPSLATAKVVGTVYDITVRDAAGRSVRELREEAEIILPYREEDLQALGVTEENLVPSYFDESVGVWIKIDTYTIDTARNVIVARMKHLTRFAIVAAADITPPLAPTQVVASALGEGQIRTTWKNPLTDFAYAKVYRSPKAGALGEVRAAEVNGEVFNDADVRDGAFYYYTIRAVDPAGNESGNQNQVSVRARGSSVALAPPPSTRPGTTTKISRTLSIGVSGEDVRTLQEFLVEENVYPEALITGFFGRLTRQAIIRFQEKYYAEILAPAGLTAGSGIAGPYTRAKVNSLLAR